MGRIKRILFKPLPIGAAWKKMSRPVKTMAERSGRKISFLRGKVLRENDLVSLQPNEKPKKDLVLENGVDAMGWTGQLDRFVKTIADMPTGKRKKEKVKQLAAFIAVTELQQFQAIRSHFDYLDLDRKGNLWFSNRGIGEEIKAPANVPAEEVIRRVRDERFAPEKNWRRSKRFLATALMAWGISEALAPSIAWMAEKGLNVEDRATLAKIDRQVRELETAENALRLQIFGIQENPALSAAEQKRQIESAQQRLAETQQKIFDSKYGRGESQIGVNARVRAKQQQVDSALRLVQRSYRPGRTVPYLPVLPLVIAGLRSYRRRMVFEKK
jgi:hypothetical protein